MTTKTTKHWADHCGFKVYTRTGKELPTWDDGFGFLWLYVESLGVMGVIRAETFEDAYSSAVDEIMADADPADPETYATSYDPSADPAELAEGHHYRGSGTPSNPLLTSTIAQEDLNYSNIVPLNSLDGRTLWSESGLRLEAIPPY